MARSTIASLCVCSEIASNNTLVDSEHFLVIDIERDHHLALRPLRFLHYRRFIQRRQRVVYG
jgi:hypothetical protein